MADTATVLIGTGDGGAKPQPLELKRAGLLLGGLFKGR